MIFNNQLPIIMIVGAGNIGKWHIQSISTLKFLTTKFLRCNIYQLSNDNINYVPKANLPKQNRSSWLFVQKNSKKTKKK